MPGKNSKQTKKFVKTKLKGALERRRNAKKIRKPSYSNKKNNFEEGGRGNQRDEEDEEVDFETAFGRNEKPHLVSLSEKEKGYVEESDEEEENGEEEESDDDEDSDQEEDGGEGDEEDETVSSTNKSLAEEVEEHKKELEILKANDPDFYKYLKTNDKKLLEFGADDEFDDLDLEEGDDIDEDEKGEAEKEEEEAEDDDQGVEEEEDSGKRAGKAKKKVITAEMLDAWERLALTETHYRAVWRLVMTFRTACHISDDADRFRKGDKFTINSSQIFNRVMVFSLKHIPKLFDRLLGNSLVVAHGQGGEGEKKEDNKQLKKVMTRSNEWSKVKKAVSAFLQNLIHFLRQLANKDMISFVLRKTTQALLPYFGAYPTIAHRYLKTLLRFWTNEDPEVRTLAYANIRGLALSVPFPFLDSCLKGIYLTYVKNSKFVTSTNLPLIEFMCESVVDLYSLDFLSSYQHAFVYIRQLAIHLRNSLSVKSKDAFRQVYNWQFVNSVRVFAQLLSQYGAQSDLRHLVYPLIQITLGTIRLIPTSRYYPLRFLLVHFLNQLSQHNNNLFVPIVPYLLEVFECGDLHRKPRPSPSTIRPIQFDVAIKISKSVLGTRIFQDGVIDKVLELLLEHFATHAYSISFPELIVPAVIQLKKYAKKCTIPPLKKNVLQLVDKLNSNTTFILGLRQRADFSPKDLKSVATFGSAEKSKGKSPLEIYYKQVLAGRKASEKNRRLYADDDDDDEVSDSGDEREGKDDEDDDEEGDEEEEEEEEEGGNKKRNQGKGSQHDKKRGKGKKGGQQQNKRKERDQQGGPSKKRGRFDEDVVKDFTLDEDDD